MTRLLEACLNGARGLAEHPGIPRTPEELAAEALAAVEAGARVLHFHPYDDDGLETLAARPCEAAIRAVSASCPGVPISLSTSAEIEPDPRRRIELISAWTHQPELVTANQGEAGIIELCEVLVDRGIGGRALGPTKSSAKIRDSIVEKSACFQSQGSPHRA